MQRFVAFWLLAVQLALTSCQPQTVDPSSRLDCWPQPGPGKDVCVKRGCIWDDDQYPHAGDTPLCYYPPNTGYIIKSETADGATLVKAHGSVNNPYDPDIEPLTFTYKQIGAGYRISIGTKGLYIPPVPINWDARIKSEDRLYVTVKNGSIFSFQVRRHSTGERIWDTSIGGLLFADRYIQIATLLPSTNVFGFGENVHHELKHDLSHYKTWGMWAEGSGPDSYNPNTKNLYSESSVSLPH
ncbi:Protein AAGR-1 [Aphelenchoides avenae]|nr:Protein AAGR-1 [Aphelenchus avenae]